MSDAGGNIPEWAVLWQQLLNVLTDDEAGDVTADAAGIEAWQQLGAALAQQIAAGTALFAQGAAQAGDVFQAMAANTANVAGGATDNASAAGAAFFSPPPMGLWQKEQRNAESLQRSTNTFLELQNAYSARLNEMLANAVRKLTERIRQQRDAGKTSHSAREIYDQWILAGEEAFAQLAHEPQFIKLQARLINALVEVRRQQQLAIEPVLRQFGLPTRADVDSLQAQVDALRTDPPTAASVRKTAKRKAAAPATKRPGRSGAKAVRRTRR